MRDKLVQALIAYDGRQSRTKSYNPFALGIYLKRVEEICEDVVEGAPVRRAILNGFTGKVLAACLKAVGEAPATKEEEQDAPMFYSR